MKEDERRLLNNIIKNCGMQPWDIGIWPRKVIENSTMNKKRAYYLLQKWVDKNWYEFGCVIDLGWMTKEGMKALG